MPSPLEAVRRLSAASLTLLLSRAEFATIELAQARAQFVRWFGLALAGGLLALLAVVTASAWFVVALWERAGWITLVVLAVGYGFGAWYVLRRLQHEIRETPPLLSQTLQELAKDRDALTKRDRAAQGESGDES